LRAQRPDIWLSVSVTTRAPRPGEVNGREYHFVNDAAFDAMVARGEPALLEIDLNGARQVREAMKDDALFVFLQPPSWEELVRRLTRRGTEPPELVQRRLDVAREELAAAGEFDVTLVNTSVQEVCRQLVTLINGQR